MSASATQGGHKKQSQRKMQNFANTATYLPLIRRIAVENIYS